VVSWECAECGRKEDRVVRVDAVCHHCGKLLCRDDRIEIADSAFASTLGQLGLTATHCGGCKRQYHAADIPLGRGEP
jgi:hypothetical protein